MAGAIRLTKAERELLVGVLKGECPMDALLAAEQRARDSILAKLEAAEKPKGAGVPARQAVEAFREVLGQRLIAPLSSAQGVWAQMQNRLNALGLSRMDCVSAAKAAAAEWPRGPIRAESIVRNADKLLQASQQKWPWGDKEPPGGWQGAQPVEMEDL